MKIKHNSGMIIFLKLLILYSLLFGLVRMAGILLNTLFNGSIADGIFIWDIREIVTVSLIISILSLSNNLYIAKAIRMDDKLLFTEMLKRVLNKMRWKLYSDSEEELVYISPFYISPWREKIIVRFTDKELQLYGPRQYVESAIKSSNFPYGAFEISNFE